jgi:hypothetical protein
VSKRKSRRIRHREHILRHPANAARLAPLPAFPIMSERCDQCLFGKDKIVSNAARAAILRELDETDNYFLCHKGTILGVDVACHGDWEQRGCGQMGRIAGRLGVDGFVTEAQLPLLPPSRKPDEDEQSELPLPPRGRPRAAAPVPNGHLDVKAKSHPSSSPPARDGSAHPRQVQD